MQRCDFILKYELTHVRDCRVRRKALYQVLDEGKAPSRQAGTLFASDKRYNVSGVQASIDPEEAGDQNALRYAYEGGRAKADAGVGEALAEGTSAQKRKIDASRGKAAKRRKEKDDFRF